MRQSTLSGAAVATLILAMPIVDAHHSPSAYDPNRTVTIEGTVTRYEWANPHVYLFVEENGSGDVWQVELAAPTIMRRLGWSSESLAPDDRIAVVGHPGRNPQRKILNFESLVGRRVDSIDLAAAFAPPPEDRPASSYRADGLAGNWVQTMGPSVGLLLPNAASLPLTAKGEAALADFAASEGRTNPGIDCVPFAAPLYMILNGVTRIDVRDHVVLILGEDAAVERVVHLDVDSHEGVAESVQGHSIGRWTDDGALIVDTARFAPHRLGIAAGVPSGREKHLVERFELRPDRTVLTYRFELDDPEYLTGTVSGGAQWVYRPDVEHVPLECDLETARRFLEE